MHPSCSNLAYVCPSNQPACRLQRYSEITENWIIELYLMQGVGTATVTTVMTVTLFYGPTSAFTLWTHELIETLQSTRVMQSATLYKQHAIGNSNKHDNVILAIILFQRCCSTWLYVRSCTQLHAGNVVTEIGAAHRFNHECSQINQERVSKYLNSHSLNNSLLQRAIC